MTFRQYRRTTSGVDAAWEEVKYRIITGVAGFIGGLVRLALVVGLIFAVVFGVVTCEDSMKHDPLKNLPPKAQKR